MKAPLFVTSILQGHINCATYRVGDSFYVCESAEFTVTPPLTMALEDNRNL